MNHKFYAALRVIPFLTILAINTPIIAQELKARDIFGIKLGATPEEVESVLKQVKPKLNIHVSVDTGRSGDEKGPVLTITAETNPNNSERKKEYIEVKFGTATERVVSVQRSHQDNDGFDRKIISEAMSQKYGAAFLSEKNQPHIGIGYNSAGKLDKKCIDWAPKGIEGCGDSFSVRFDGYYSKTDLYYGYEARLLDRKALIDNVKATEAKFVAKDQEMARKAQERARSAKPAL